MDLVGSQRSSYDELLALVKGLSARVEALTAKVSLLETENAELRVDNAGLRTENVELRADNAGLRAENVALKRKLGTDSSNSSTPPSQDSLAAKWRRRGSVGRSVRSGCGRRTGSQVASRDGRVRVWCRLPSRIGPRPRRFRRIVRGCEQALSKHRRARPPPGCRRRGRRTRTAPHRPTARARPRPPETVATGGNLVYWEKVADEDE
jgi:regulator of replication initiation timing